MSELRQLRPLSQIEKEGVIQRFEYCWKLTWKLLTDLLNDGGPTLDTVTPKNVIRAAFTVKLIDDGKRRIRALDGRNLMSRTYNAKGFEKAFNLSGHDYLLLLATLVAFFDKKSHA